MRYRTAVLLAFHSERAYGAPLRSPLARAAWRALATAAAHGDRTAILALWQAWLHHPDDERWELLAHCRGAQEMADAVFAAAIDPARPATSRAAIGAFCTSHGLVPDGTTERALFYMLTGQTAQHRAADPEGEALAAAYQGVDEPVRAALRQAMADSGDFDLARVVAARRDNPVPTGEAERAFVVSELTRRRDWSRLWLLAQDLPLAEAVAAARRLPRRWRPAGQAGRELLPQLMGARPAEIMALAAPAVIRLNVRFQEDPSRCFFAPDGSAMAVNGWAHSVVQPRLTLYALPGGGREAGFSNSAAPEKADKIAVFPGGVVFLGLRRGGLDRRLFRYVNGNRTEEFTESDVRIFPRPQLAAMPGGFVVAEPGRLLYGTSEPGSGLRDVTPPGSRLATDADTITSVATEPHSGCVAIVVRRLRPYPDHLLVLGPDFKVIDQVDVPGTDGAEISWMGFCGPGRLITRHGDTQIRSWRVGPPTEAEAATELLGGEWTVRPVPSAGLVMTEFFNREYLDAGTLQPAECPATLAWVPQGDGRLYLSSDGRYAALWRSWHGKSSAWREHGAHKGEIEVHDLVREEFSELGCRPLASFRPADLAAVTNLAGRAGDRPVRTALELLRTCLEHRFGADLAIRDAFGPVPGTDDIRLSAEPWRG